MTRSEQLLPYMVGVCAIALLVGCWELAGALRLPVSIVLPPPSQFIGVVADSGFRIGMGSQAVTVWQSLFSTFVRVFAGMGLAFVAAVFTGALISLSRPISWALAPILHLLAPIAPIAWIPTAIVVFGVSNTAAIFIVFMGVYFILTLATLAEIRRLPPEFDIVAGNLGAGPVDRFFRVTLPAILPGVFTLLRSNFTAAWMAVLVAEMVGLRDGLGAVIMMGRNLFNNDLIMFGMVIIGVSGFVVDRTLHFIGQKIIWWRV